MNDSVRVLRAGMQSWVEVRGRALANRCMLSHTSAAG